MHDHQSFEICYARNKNSCLIRWNLDLFLYTLLWFLLSYFQQAEFMSLLGCLLTKNEYFAFSHIREICIKVGLEYYILQTFCLIFEYCWLWSKSFVYLVIRNNCVPFQEGHKSQAWNLLNQVLLIATENRHNRFCLRYLLTVSLKPNNFIKYMYMR